MEYDKRDIVAIILIFLLSLMIFIFSNFIFSALPFFFFSIISWLISLPINVKFH